MALVVLCDIQGAGKSTFKRLEVPRNDDGFAEPWRVAVAEDGFAVAPLPGALPEPLV